MNEINIDFDWKCLSCRVRWVVSFGIRLSRGKWMKVTQNQILLNSSSQANWKRNMYFFSRLWKQNSSSFVLSFIFVFSSMCFPILLVYLYIITNAWLFLPSLKLQSSNNNIFVLCTHINVNDLTLCFKYLCAFVFWLCIFIYFFSLHSCKANEYPQSCQSQTRFCFSDLHFISRCLLSILFHNLQKSSSFCSASQLFFTQVPLMYITLLLVWRKLNFHFPYWRKVFHVTENAVLPNVVQFAWNFNSMFLEFLFLPLYSRAEFFVMFSNFSSLTLLFFCNMQNILPERDDSWKFSPTFTSSLLLDFYFLSEKCLIKFSEKTQTL